MKKKKCYVLMLAKSFPAHHPRKGDPTDFAKKIEEGTKIHTIRSNYEGWKKKIDEINAGKAYLSVREWTGKPYRSKQNELFQYYELGVQKADYMHPLGLFIDYCGADHITDIIADNDGLTPEDLSSWFAKTAFSNMAIIHFTDFRYSK